MENKKVKKVTVELEDGNKMEFSGQVVLFAEDKMSEIEKTFNGDCSKICGIVKCRPSFLASVTNSALETLKKNAPGLDTVVMMKHLDSKHSIMSVLEDILG